MEITENMMVPSATESLTAIEHSIYCSIGLLIASAKYVSHIRLSHIEITLIVPWNRQSNSSIH